MRPLRTPILLSHLLRGYRLLILRVSASIATRCFQLTGQSGERIAEARFFVGSETVLEERQSRQTPALAASAPRALLAQGLTVDVAPRHCSRKQTLVESLPQRVLTSVSESVYQLVVSLCLSDPTRGRKVHIRSAQIRGLLCVFSDVVCGGPNRYCSPRRVWQDYA